MKVLYGSDSNYIDITEKCTSLCAERIAFVPADDEIRGEMFGDPIFGVVKDVVVTDDYHVRRVLSHSEVGVVIKNRYGKYDLSQSPDLVWQAVKWSSLHPVYKLQVAHARLRLDHGSLCDELPEQLMAIQFVKPNACVLELGGNIGRNSCLIASILEDSANMVVFECDPNISLQLQQNRDQNGFRFAIETKALSKRRLIQNGWVTKPIGDDQTVPLGWTVIDTIPWSQVQEKHVSLPFDTLVADCEGALYYILVDEPDFLTSFHTVILENDFLDIKHKEFVDAELARNGFRLVYNEPLFNSTFPCSDHFFQTWQKESHSGVTY